MNDSVGSVLGGFFTPATAKTSDVYLMVSVIMIVLSFTSHPSSSNPITSWHQKKLESTDMELGNSTVNHPPAWYIVGS